MYYLYILMSKKDGQLYVGYTNDLRRRLSEHNSGKSRATMNRRPFELRYYEAYICKDDAQKREASLKRDGRALAMLKVRASKSLK